MSTNIEKKITLIQKLDQSTPAGVANLPEVADRFKSIYKIMNGGDTAVANVRYEAEKFHFMKLITDKPELQKCTKLSLYGCFIDMAVNGLSFDPAMKHAYVISRSIKITENGQERWENRANVEIDGRGELIIRTRQGQIKYADNPILVYEGDFFEFGTTNGHVFLEHKAVYPRKTDIIIACYLRIERPDGSVDYKVLGMDEVMKLREFSKQKNSLAWTNGLPGMVQTKTIKHAFRSYPKVKLGNFSTLATASVDPEEKDVVIDYGLGDTVQEPPVTQVTQINSTPTDNKEAFTEATVIETEKQPGPIENISDESFMETEKVAPEGKSFDDDDF